MWLWLSKFRYWITEQKKIFKNIRFFSHQLQIHALLRILIYARRCRRKVVELWKGNKIANEVTHSHFKFWFHFTELNEFCFSLFFHSSEALFDIKPLFFRLPHCPTIESLSLASEDQGTSELKEKWAGSLVIDSGNLRFPTTFWVVKTSMQYSSLIVRKNLTVDNRSFFTSTNCYVCICHHVFLIEQCTTAQSSANLNLRCFPSYCFLLSDLLS